MALSLCQRFDSETGSEQRAKEGAWSFNEIDVEAVEEPDEGSSTIM